MAGPLPTDNVFGDQRFFEQYSRPRLPPQPDPAPKNVPLAQAMLKAQEQGAAKYKTEWQGIITAGLSSAEEREAVALAEAARLREELRMAEHSLSLGGCPETFREYSGKIQRLEKDLAEVGSQASMAQAHERNAKRLWDEVQRLEQEGRKLRQLLKAAEATQTAPDVTHGVEGYRDALAAAWTILRAVEPEMFARLKPGETIGDFASRLPPKTERAVVAALFAHLLGGAS